MFGIARIIKAWFSKPTEEKLGKTIFDSKLGKLVCNYKPSDDYFSWETELKQPNAKEPISIWIDGDLNGPYSNALQKAYEIVDSISDITYKVQQEIDNRFPEKKVNLSDDYNLEDISVFVDEETKSIDFELEYYTEDSKIMISVEFIADTIESIDFY